MNPDQKGAGKRKKRDWVWIPPDMGCAIILPVVFVLILIAVFVISESFDAVGKFISDIGGSAMPPSVWIIFGVAVVVMAALICLPLLILRRKIEDVIAVKFKNRAILLKSQAAVYLGPDDPDDEQPTGRGALVLGEDELWFLLPHPIYQLSIPLTNVSAVSPARAHRGRTHRRELLRVEFWTESGSQAAAWRVKNPAAWRERIEEIIKRED